MVLRVVRLATHAALLLHVLQSSVFVMSSEVNRNFENTKLSPKDKTVSVVPAKLSSLRDEDIKNQEERSFFGLGDSGPPPEAGLQTQHSDGIAMGGPTFKRPSTAEFLKKHGGFLKTFEGSSSRASMLSAAQESDAADSGSSGTTDDALLELSDVESESISKKESLTKDNLSASTTQQKSGDDMDMTSLLALLSGSGSNEGEKDEVDDKPSAKKTKKSAAAAELDSDPGEESTMEDDTSAKKKKKSGDDTDMKSLLALLGDGSEGNPGEESTMKDDTSAKKKKKSGDDTDMKSLLALLSGSGSNGNVETSANGSPKGMESLLSNLLGGDSTPEGALGSFGGSGSMPSFEEFMEKYGSMFGEGAAGFSLFGDPTEPQNKTVNDKDIILGEVYGALEHGYAFSDIQNIMFGQMLRNITIRGDKRVDQIGITPMTMETIGMLVHGGTGGGLAYVEPELGDTIVSVEVHWGKHKGKTSIFYMHITTSGGKTLSAGTKTANTAIIKPPENYQIAGFHGRADGNGIYGIGAIFTNTTATDLAVTDVMAVSPHGSPDIYNYNTTIRNWLNTIDKVLDGACYQKRLDVSSKKMCPSGYRQEDDECVTQCPLGFPIDCLRECITQNSDCTQAVIAKVVSVVSVALNVATMGVFGAFLAAYKTASWVISCAVSVANAVKSIIFYLRYRQTTIPQTDIERLMDKAFQLQIATLDLPLAICACLGIRIPPKLLFSVTVVGITSAVVMMAVMVGEVLFSSKKNVLIMLRESGVMNGTTLHRHTVELDTFLNSKNGTCGHEMKTLTNRVIGKVQEIRSSTPGADKEDVRVEVSRSPIITEDIPIITNHCMGEIWSNHTDKASFRTRELLRKTLGVIIEQLIEDGTTDMGKNVYKKEKMLNGADTALFIMSMLDPTGIAWMASEFVQPICTPTEYLGEIDDGTLYQALGLTTVDEAFAGSYGIWKKEGDGSVTVHFESSDKYDVSVVIFSGGDKINEVKVPAKGVVTWTATVKDLQDKTFYMDRWRPGLFGLLGSGGGSLLMWVPRSSRGGQLILHARINVS